jgi:ABC-type branched-subunit amino acid transport system permease subunit
MSALRSARTKRLLACLAGSLVVALMWGPQEGSQTDYGYAFRQSVLKPRVFVFLALGVLVFLAISFRHRVVPYLTRPGVWPLVAGGITVLAAQTLMHWYDAVGDAKFGTVSDAVASSGGLSPLAKAFFGWLAWAQLVVVFGLAATAIATQFRPLGWAAAGLAVAAAIVCYVAHRQVLSFAGGVDHSLGASVAVVGYLVMATAAAIAARSAEEMAHTREAVNRILGWRPGLPLVVLGAVLGLIAFIRAAWFSPQRLDATMADTRSLFSGTRLSTLGMAYLTWLGWTLLAVTLVLAGAAAYLRRRPLGWVAVGVGVVAVALTLITIYGVSDVGASLNVDSATGPWQNLGAGGWTACAAFFLLAASGYVAATAPDLESAGPSPASAPSGTQQAAGGRSASAAYLTAPGALRTALALAVAVALFYPPTATSFWQQVLVSEVGIYVLLAIGLNVVVGWAGLLDLGFIAFYAIGSYTTAYLVGALPVHPPSWLQMSPLLAIPFAVTICLLAGLALGAPTLRLRGDYLAIVTLGFGEIIRIIAVNADPITNGSRGPSSQVPHPVIHVGPVHLTWGLNQLQYWYLLLVFVVIVLLAFRRLENSRIGRAWAAIREDEIAAQATGINTFKVKLLAFAIGASTSGLSGVFFASQIGFFVPDNFVLNNSILVVAYVVFGGMGSLSGAMAGAALLTWLPEFLKDQVPGADRQMWIGAVVLAMMIFRPGGLIPSRRRQAELSGLGAPASAETTAVAAGEGLGARA